MKIVYESVLKDMYGLRVAESTGWMRSCFATNCKEVKCTEFTFNYVVNVVDENDNVVTFNIHADDFLTEEYLIMTNEETGVSIYVSRFPFGVVNLADDRLFVFADLSHHKFFSRWLYNLDNDKYTSIVENEQYVPSIDTHLAIDVYDMRALLDKEFCGIDTFNITTKGIPVTEAEPIKAFLGQDIPIVPRLNKTFEVNKDTVECIDDICENHTDICDRLGVTFNVHVKGR